MPLRGSTDEHRLTINLSIMPYFGRIIIPTIFLLLTYSVVKSQETLIKKDNLLSFMNYEKVDVYLPMSLDSLIKCGRTIALDVVNSSQLGFPEIGDTGLSDSIVNFLSNQFDLFHILIRDNNGNFQFEANDTISDSKSSMVKWCKERKIKLEASYFGTLSKNPEYQSHLFFVVLTDIVEPIFWQTIFFILNTKNSKIISCVELAYKKSGGHTTIECLPKKLDDNTFYCKDVFKFKNDVVSSIDEDETKNDIHSVNYKNYYMKFRFDKLGFVRIVSD
jgi:hypothetical protein